MANKGNIDAYIERKVAKELDSRIRGMLEGRLKALKPGNIMRSSLAEYRRSTLRQYERAFGGALFGQHLGFGASSAQFAVSFASEISRLIFRNLY